MIERVHSIALCDSFYMEMSIHRLRRLWFVTGIQW